MARDGALPSESRGYAPTPTSSIASMQPRVLVVDDEDDIRQAIAECLLDGCRFEVITAATGAEALEVLRGWAPDLIVVDFVMPGMSGQELVDECRRNPRLASIPVLVTTAMKGAHVDGAIAHLDKPFDVEQLLEAVRNCLGNRDAERPALGMSSSVRE